MGVLVNYTIELTPEEVLLFGMGLDLLPHGKVAALVRKVQAQINGQETAIRAQTIQGAELGGQMADVPKPLKRKNGRPHKIRETSIPIEAAVHLTNGGAVS